MIGPWGRLSVLAVQRRALSEAARRALAAPSIYNTQPWRWSLVDDTLQLWAERERQLAVTDPDARQLMISCAQPPGWSNPNTRDPAIPVHFALWNIHCHLVLSPAPGRFQGLGRKGPG